MIKIVLCGYRDWAKKIFESIQIHSNVKIIDIITSHEEYIQKENNFTEEIDIILFIGWSWIIPKETTDKFLCLGIHPSNLPYFRGGSPLQHQIIAGIEKSKVTLMTLSSEKLDAGDIWIQEDLDLLGDTMIEIFDNLIHSSIKLINSFFDKYPKIDPHEQNTKLGSYFKRRLPMQSQLTKDQIQNMSLKQLYNYIRALTDPYPNAYIEDEEGNRLYFKEVKYIHSNRKLKD
jgi:methionyl-tRNA formyltransferase